MPGAAQTDRIDRILRMSRTKPDAKSRPNAHSFRYSEKGAAVLECALALARASQVWRTPELASTVTTKSISPALPEAAPLRQRAASLPRILAGKLNAAARPPARAPNESYRI